MLLRARLHYDDVARTLLKSTPTDKQTRKD
jgi:hypothetical protein